MKEQGERSAVKQALLAVREMQEKLDAVERSRSEPIAVIGVGCRFPGGGNDPDSFWSLLDEGRDATADIPLERFDVDAVSDSAAIRRAAMIGGIDQFDPLFFNISPREAARMDPQQRILLEVAWEALEHAGVPVSRLAGTVTGSFVGIMGNDYAQLQFANIAEINAYTSTGTQYSLSANRLAYHFDLKGPSIAVDTACSSSLVAAHLACQSLRVRECDIALAAGVNLIISPAVSVSYDQWGMLSADGRCKTFDARANGFVRGEGCGVVVLKRLRDAIAAGDRILALIRGSAVNQDGRTSVITAPSGLSQAAVIRSAIANAGVRPEEVAYIETHGTGTPLGDPIEVEALASVYAGRRSGDRRCALGAVKTNMGHLEGAAGIVGLIKTILCVSRGKIPRNLHFERLNPNIALDATPFILPGETLPWPAGYERRFASVSSFGAGGTNAHVVLEEAPPRPEASPAEALAPARPALLPLSAKSPEALLALADAYRLELSRRSADATAALDDLAFTASVRRSHLEHRVAVVGVSWQELEQGLAAFVEGAAHPSVASGRLPTGPRPKIAFVFSGQGSQWVGMGRRLLGQEPAFAEALTLCDAALRSAAGWSLLEELNADATRSRLEQVDVIQPCIFALQVALSALWRSWGVEPDAVLGHSMGEVAAACVAGALSVGDAARVICTRSLLAKRTSGRGAMAVVDLPGDQAIEAIKGFEARVSVAAFNGPSSTLLSGEPEAVARIVARLSADQVFCRSVKVDYASHSAQMDPLREDLLSALRDVRPGAARVPIRSTVTNTWSDGKEMDAAYWFRNLREPVQLFPAVKALLEDGYGVLIEQSPHPVIAPALSQSIDKLGKQAHVVTSLRREQDERTEMLAGLSQLYCLGQPVDLAKLFPRGGKVISLPSYPFQRQRCWLEAEPPPELFTRSKDAGVEADDVFFALSWQRLAELPERTSPPARSLGAFLLVGDSTGLADAVEAQLLAAGDDVVRVVSTDADDVNPAHRRVDPTSKEAFEAVLKEAFSDERPCRSVIHLASLDDPPVEQSSAGALESALLRGAGGLLSLVQALARTGWRDLPRLWLVTRGSQAAGKEPLPIAVTSAALWGMGQTLAYEHPELQCARIDLGPVGSTDEASALLREIRAASREDEIALRPEGRYGCRLIQGAAALGRRAPAGRDPTAASLLSADATYLITGGLGGLGLAAAKWMVDEGARHLVLVGRRTQTDAQAAAVAELTAAGAEVLVAQADVSDHAALGGLLETLRERMPPLRGLIHAAGVLEDGILVQQDLSRFRKVMAPKAIGAMNLHLLTRGTPLDFFVLYSSVASILGSPGQSNYTAANTVLDALAHHRRALGLPALSINWGAISEVGLAAQAERGTRLAERGVRSMTPAEGIAMLARLLRASAPEVGAVRLDLKQWVEFYPQAASSARFSKLLSSAAGPSAARPKNTAAREALRAAAPADRGAVLERFLRDQVAQVLRIDASRIERQTPFQSLGVDSLTGLELRNRVESGLGLSLSATLIWTYPTVARLSEHLTSQLAESLAREGSLKSPAPADLADRSDEVPRASMRDVRSRAEGARSSLDAEPIAIIGMGCRFPGGANDPEGFWRLLKNGADVIRKVPSDRWPLDTALSSMQETRFAGFLDAVDGFDASFFGIAPREATTLDPQQRLLLEVTWEALEHAGVAPDRLAGSRTGVFLGICGLDYQQQVLSRSPEKLDTYAFTGNLFSVTAGRLAYFFGLQGPCLSIDTACSSSLVAAHVACRSLRSGESDLALVGGVNLLLSPLTMYLAARTQALSPDGRCRTFDARANGFVRGEGCGVLVLKRLSDAERDGDTIWALIRGSAVNQDGRSTGLTAPNVLSQQRLLHEALKDARVSPSEIGYVEAHGTGTSLGDPIELEALKAVLGGPRPEGPACALSSVKTNLGHTEGAAGVAGLIKVVLSLNHETIPRHLHFQTLNPRISLEGTPFTIPVEEIAWKRSTSPRIAGVSSFGISGTNAHVIVEEAPQRPDRPRDVALDSAAVLLPLSAKSDAALRALANAYRAHLDREDSDAGETKEDIAYTASVLRSHHEHRLAVVGGSRAELAQGLAAFLGGESHPGVVAGKLGFDERPKVVFIFPGQGSQWPGMGRELLDEEPAFREALAACDAAIRPLTGWSLLELLSAPEPSSLLEPIDVIQPALFALEVALSALWRSFGVEPDAVVGHSMGEIAAAHVAGALSLEDAAQIICQRSALLRRVSGKGAMAVVELPWAEAAQALSGYEDRVSVAVSNSPRSTVLSGDPEALDELLGTLEARQIFCRRVKVDVASHSPQMDPLQADLLAILSGVAPRPAAVPIYSTVSGEVSDGSSFDAAYWVRNLRQPVRFAGAIEQLVGAGHTLFVEVSPHPILLPAVEPMLREGGAATAARAVVSSLRRGQAERRAMLESLGLLYTRGYPIDFRRRYPAGGRCAQLPTYPWQRERYWVEADASSGPTYRALREGSSGEHPLLGGLLTSSIQPGARFWETTLRQKTPAYLADHRVQGAVVVPGAAFVEMALAAARAAWGAGAHEVEKVTFREALVLPDQKAQKVQLALTEEEPGRLFFRIASQEEKDASSTAQAWTLHASGWIRMSKARAADPAPRGEPLAAIRARCPEEVSGEAYYASLALRGLPYGPCFQGIEQVFRGTAEALGRVRLREPVVAEASAYELHPTLLDASLQVLGAAQRGAGAAAADTGPVVPVSLRHLLVHERPGAEVWSHAKIQREDARGFEGDVVLRDASGKVLVEVLGLSAKHLEAQAPKHPSEEDGFFLAVDWQRQERPKEPAPRPNARRGSWLLLADQGGVAEAVRAKLEARGEAVVSAVGKGATAPSGPGYLQVDPASPDAFDEVLKAAFPAGARCRGVVQLFSLDSGAEEAPSAEALEAALVRGCDATLHLVQAIARAGFRDPPRLWLVTRGAQAVGAEPRAIAIAQAPLVGLGRTITYEHAELRCAQIDLDPRGSPDEASSLVEELFTETREEELALRADARYAGRLVRKPPGMPAPEALVPPGAQPFRMEIAEPGILDRLALRPIERRQPGAGEVAIEVEAIGLNFIDVMKALGIYPGLPEGPIPLGGEVAGRITALGDGVEGLHVGQEVMALTPFSSGSAVVTKRSFVVARPPSMAAEEAASLPSAFMTAWYALYHLARLQKGERILIHSAAGGVGLAAVQLARRVGAEVLATAGSAEKRAYLKELGIAQVMDSRSLDFAEEVMAATHGEGVDVVLNSLAGEAIEKSLSILAEDGRFLELGKRDIYTDHRTLPLSVFRKRLSYHAVDLLGFAGQRPDRFSALFHEAMDAFTRGELKPSPVKVFPVSEAKEAFRLMAQGRHVGKLVISLRDPNVRVAVPLTDAGRLRADGTYLLTGGLGGLGLSVARWMVSGGARHLVLLGRRGAVSAAQEEAIAALRAGGAEVLLAEVDVSDREALAATLRDLEARTPPLRGVIHAAAVLDDGLLLQQSADRFREVMAPKVAGAYNLHLVTRDKPLDFFVLYAAGAGLLGSPGQGGYAAANTFLDALAHHRRALGLTALSIDWGAFSEVGLAAAQANRGERLSYRGVRSLTPDQGNAILGRLLCSDAVEIGVVPFDLRQWTEFYPHTAASPRLLPLAQGSAGARQPVRGDVPLLRALGEASPAERKAALERLVTEQVAEVLRLSVDRIDRQSPLRTLGIDSLMSLELRNRLEVELALTLPATLTWTYPNVMALAEHLGDKLHLSLARDSEEGSLAPKAEQEADAREAAALQGLSEEEKIALLNEELKDLDDLLSI